MVYYKQLDTLLILFLSLYVLLHYDGQGSIVQLKQGRDKRREDNKFTIYSGVEMSGTTFGPRLSDPTVKYVFPHHLLQ